MRPSNRLSPSPTYAYPDLCTLIQPQAHKCLQGHHCTSALLSKPASCRRLTPTTSHHPLTHALVTPSHPAPTMPSLTSALLSIPASCKRSGKSFSLMAWSSGFRYWAAMVSGSST